MMDPSAASSINEEPWPPNMFSIIDLTVSKKNIEPSLSSTETTKTNDPPAATLTNNEETWPQTMADVVNLAMATEYFKNTLGSSKATKTTQPSGTTPKNDKPWPPRFLDIVVHAVAKKVLDDHFVSSEAAQNFDFSVPTLNDGKLQEAKQLYAIDEVAGKEVDDHIRKRVRREEGNVEIEGERLSRSHEGKKRIRCPEDETKADVKKSMTEEESKEDN